MTSRSRYKGAIALVSSFMLLAAACGSDKKSTATTATTVAAATTTAAATATTAAGSVAPGSAAPGSAAPGTATGDTAGGGTTPGSAAGSTPAGTAGCPAIDASLDKVNGTGAGRFESDLTCAGTKPLKATGDPVVIGFQNPEGDPNGSFPEYTLAAQATVDYINNELGGLGADVQNGKAGRPIKLEVCKMAISPDDSQRCANELIAKKPTMVFSSLNFFGNQFPIYTAAKVPAIVITPITVGDFTSPSTYAIGGGGGCLGVHTGLIKFTTQNLKAKKVGIPWADTPPGVVCYYDLEAKPMDVLSGKVKGTSPLAGSEPDLTYVGVPIKPATPDVTAQVTQILDFKPDAIIFSGQGADCWNLVGGLGRLGWNPTTTPLVLSGACIDFDAMKAAGDLAKGVYFVGSSGTILNDPATIKDSFSKFEATIYQTKPSQFGLAADQLKKGFATQGVTGLLSLWELSGQIVRSGGELTSDSLANAYKVTAGQHLFGSTPLSCSTAPAPYVAVCNASVAVSQWDGTKLNTVVPLLSGIDLVAGTQLKPGP
jgi:branched-chain amino acid transport system substrate-binding protein